MSDLEIQRLPAMGDNYIYLIIHDDAAGVVDPGVAEPVQAALDGLNVRLTHILLTHHHHDHTGGCSKLNNDCEIIGPDDSRLPWCTQRVGEGDSVSLFGRAVSVLDVPGHTDPHLAFCIEDRIFCGDSLFAGGCGRLFEGTPAQMWDSLCKIRQLPDETMVYCGHEYTLNNLEFAASIDRENADLLARLEQVRRQRADGEATVPFRLGEDKHTNPFLRADESALQTLVGAADPVATFAELRSRKDRW